MAKAVVLTGPGSLELQDIGLPESDEGMILDVLACGVCGTDPHVVDGRISAPYPVIPGHEFYGRVAEIGERCNVECLTGPVQVGDLVTVLPGKSCGKCAYCISCDEEHLCTNRRTYGLNLPTDVYPCLGGGYSEKAVIFDGFRLYHVPSHWPFGLGAFLETCAVGVNAVERALSHSAPTKNRPLTALVLGCGPVGFSVVLALKGKGIHTAVVEPIEERRNLALGIGADLVLSPDTLSREPETLSEQLEGLGPDIVVEAVGTPRAFIDSLRYVRRGGTVVELGNFANVGNAELSPSTICRNGLIVLGCALAPPSSYFEAEGLLEGLTKTGLVSRILSPVFTLDRVEDAIENVRKVKSGLKSLLIPGLTKEHDRTIDSWAFPQTVEECGYSEISEMVKRANALGPSVIHLEIGDVDFSPPDSIKIGTVEALDLGRTHYPAFRGERNLIDAIVETTFRDCGLRIDPDQVLVTSGGSMGMYIAFSTLLNPGDEVLVPTPIWPHLIEMIKLVRAVPVSVPLSPDKLFHLDIAAFRSSLTERTKAILINSPNNPTGAVYSLSEVSDLVAFAHDHNLAIISDEEYEAFCYSGRKVVSPLALYDATVISRSFSKTLAIPGMRLGYLIGPARWTERMTRLSLYSSMYSSSVAQYAVSYALNGDQSFTKKAVSKMEARMNLVMSSLNGVGGLRCLPSEGSVYSWLDCRELENDDRTFCSRLLQNARVALVPGSGFGDAGRGFVRLSLGVPDELLLEAVRRIKQEILGEKIQAKTILEA